MNNQTAWTSRENGEARPARTETYTLISKIAYLAGVEQRIFEDPCESPKLDCFLELNRNPDTRIIRNLCRLRTAIEQNFSRINECMRYELKNLDTLPQLVPPDCLSALAADGVDILRANYRLDRYLMDVNLQIADHIHRCKPLFPLWLNWSYIRELFIMPKGGTEQGLKRAAAVYCAHMRQYPYQVYLNWTPAEDGNILYNDRKFVTLLYARHNDRFREESRVSDAGAAVKDSICRFMEESRHAAVIVDCENADPYKLHAMLTGLDRETLLDRVRKIILYNDVHTSSAWKILDQFTDIPVEHCMTKRIKADKSLVDIQLAAGLCREHYENGTDTFILLSSDSDYWGLISAMPQIRFLVMVEDAKCSPAMKATLESGSVPYCCIDSFCTSDSSRIMFDALHKEVVTRLKASSIKDLNILVLLEQAYQAVHANMTAKEKQMFFDRCIRSLRIVFAGDGQAVIQMG